MCCFVFQGVVFLYDWGFDQVGQIHTGNVFLDGDICRLGGYENTVLGYEPHSAALFADYWYCRDTLMFGKEWFEVWFYCFSVS